MQIKADGVAHIEFYRAWVRLVGVVTIYKVLRRKFPTNRDADEYGKRVAERYNRIFGQEAVKNVQP